AVGVGRRAVLGAVAVEDRRAAGDGGAEAAHAGLALVVGAAELRVRGAGRVATGDADHGAAPVARGREIPLGEAIARSGQIQVLIGREIGVGAGAAVLTATERGRRDQRDGDAEQVAHATIIPPVR